MLCKNCGNELLGNEKFCPTCGTPVQLDEREQAISLSETTTVEEPTNFDAAVRRDVYSVVTPALVMEEVDKADATVVEYTPYEEDIVKCQGKLVRINNVGTFLGVLAGIASAWLFGSLHILNFWTIILVVLIGFMAAEGYKKKFSSPVNEKISADNAAIQEILARSESCIPARYIYANAVNYIRELIAAGRAKTLADAIDRLEEQEHRWEVEAQNNQMILEQKEQSARLRSIEVASWGNFWKR